MNGSVRSLALAYNFFHPWCYHPNCFTCFYYIKSHVAYMHRPSFSSSLIFPRVEFVQLFLFLLFQVLIRVYLADSIPYPNRQSQVGVIPNYRSAINYAGGFFLILNGGGGQLYHTNIFQDTPLQKFTTTVKP